MSHIFISYSHKDRNYVERLEKKLIEEGFNVWIDHRIDYGTQWPKAIQKALDACDAFIVVVTENAFESEWVQNEVARAKRKGKPIFPLLLEGEPWLFVEVTQYVDVTDGALPTSRFFESLARVTSSKKKIIPESFENSKVDELFVNATRLNINGYADKALQLYRQIKEIDPYYPDIDLSIRNLEDEIRRGYIDYDGRVNVEKIRSKETRRIPFSLTLVTVLTCIFIVISGLFTKQIASIIASSRPSLTPMVGNPTATQYSSVFPTSTKVISMQLGYLEGIVTDRDGNPISNLSINISNGPATVTDSEGRFFLNNVLEGDQIIIVKSPSGSGQDTLNFSVIANQTNKVNIVYDPITSRLGLLSIISPVDGGELEVRQEIEDGNVISRATVYGRSDGLGQIFLNGFDIWILISSERDNQFWVQFPPAIIDTQNNTWKANILLGSPERPPVNGEIWTIVAVAAEPDSGFNWIISTPKLSLLPSHITSNIVSATSQIK